MEPWADAATTSRVIVKTRNDENDAVTIARDAPTRGQNKITTPKAARVIANDSRFMD